MVSATTQSPSPIMRTTSILGSPGSNRPSRTGWRKSSQIARRPRSDGNPRATSLTIQTESSSKNSPTALKSPVLSVAKKRDSTSLGSLGASDILTSFAPMFSRVALPRHVPSPPDTRHGVPRQRGPASARARTQSTSGGTRERQVRDATRARHGLYVESPLEPFEPVPDPLTAPEDDRHQRDVHVVDQVGRQELADGRRPAADADIKAARRLQGDVQRLARARVDEMERRAALHLDRRPRVVGEHEHRR